MAEGWVSLECGYWGVAAGSEGTEPMPKDETSRGGSFYNPSILGRFGYCFSAVMCGGYVLECSACHSTHT